MKKSIKEGSMSDVDLMAKEASSFKEFVKEFYKEFRDFPKTREAMKWLEDTYKSVSEGTESDELERVADALPQTVEEMINEISLSSAGVRDFLRALYRNNTILKKLGFANFKGAVDYIKSNGGRDWDELRDEATGFGLKFESVNESKKMFSVHSTGSKKFDINVYDGRKNKDGSPFIDVVTANHNLELKDKIQAYKSKGYIEVDNVGKKLGIKYKTESVNKAGCGCGCGCGGSTLKENAEPTIISQLKDIVKHNQNKVLVDPKSGKKMRVDLYSASAITQVYDALKQQSNKDKFVGSGLMGMQSMAMKLLK